MGDLPTTSDWHDKSSTLMSVDSKARKIIPFLSLKRKRTRQKLPGPRFGVGIAGIEPAAETFDLRRLQA